MQDIDIRGTIHQEGTLEHGHIAYLRTVLTGNAIRWLKH